LFDLQHGGLHRHDFFRNPARLDGLRIALLALQRVLVLGLARHLVASRHHFRGVAHGHEDLGLLFEQALILLCLGRFLAVAHGDRVDPAGDGHLGLAGRDLIGGHGDGLQARRSRSG
jgi:hypothetical protein